MHEGHHHEGLHPVIPADQRAEFTTFVTSESSRLLRVAYLLVGDHGHAEDVLQTALFRTARRWQQARRDPGAYTRRTIINLAKDRWRAKSRRPAEAELTVDPSIEGSGGFEERDALLRACRRLPPGQRAVLVLRFFEDLGVDETAAVLQCSAGTVKSQTHEGLANLRALLHHDTLQEDSHADR